MCLSQISLIIADETQNNKPQITAKEQLPHLSVFLCEIMQLAAFVCVICAICGRITRKSTQSIRTEEIPKSLADNRRRNPKQQTPNNRIRTITSPICLSLRNNAARCIRLRDLRYLRENNTQEYSINPHNETPMSLADLADNRRRTPKQQAINNPNQN